MKKIISLILLLTLSISCATYTQEKPNYFSTCPDIDTSLNITLSYNEPVVYSYYTPRYTTNIYTNHWPYTNVIYSNDYPGYYGYYYSYYPYNGYNCYYPYYTFYNPRYNPIYYSPRPFYYFNGHNYYYGHRREGIRYNPNRNNYTPRPTQNTPRTYIPRPVQTPRSYTPTQNTPRTYTPRPVQTPRSYTPRSNGGRR